MRRFIFFFVVFSLFAPVGQAGIILGNLPASNDNTGTDFMTIQYKAMGFLMGATAVSLESITYRYEMLDILNFGIGFMHIYSDAAGLPGASLAQNHLAYPLGPGTFENTVGFGIGPGGNWCGNCGFPTLPFTLEANTAYWLVLSAQPVSTQGPLPFRWLASSPGITPAGPLATHTGGYTSTDGINWNNSTIFNSYQLNGTVPEPGTVWLGGLALAGLAVRFRRRTQR
jgi:hypothetical protein